MGFFDDYKLKTEKEIKEQQAKNENDPAQKHLSLRGAKGEETGHMDDMIDRDSKEIAKVLQAVNRVCTEEDPIDAIIANRITNQDVTDGFTHHGRSRKFTAVNMNDFINQVTVFNNHFTNRVTKNNHMSSGQADIFE